MSAFPARREAVLFWVPRVLFLRSPGFGLRFLGFPLFSPLFIFLAAKQYWTLDSTGAFPESHDNVHRFFTAWTTAKITRLEEGHVTTEEGWDSSHSASDGISGGSNASSSHLDDSHSESEGMSGGIQHDGWSSDDPDFDFARGQTAGALRPEVAAEWQRCESSQG